MSEALDLKTFPLQGARLIEASAGTGKTFTISALVLRLLLGADEHQAALPIESILVVTFTEAATAELRGRIRAKIHQARLDFLRGHSNDALTASLIQESADIREDAERLLVAEQGMDQAAIFTIHGFCQRMLKEHAFESGISFESEFLTAEHTLRLRAVEDCWRQFFYPLPKAMIERVMSFWSDPASLLSSLQGVLAQPQLQLEGGDPTLNVQQWFEQRLARIEAFKTRWRRECDGLVEALQAADLDKRSYSRKNLPNWLDEIHQFAAAASSDEQLPKNLHRFGSELLREKTKTGAPPIHPLIEAIDELFADNTDLRALILAQLIAAIRERFVVLKTQQQQLGFDDLLSILANALDGQHQGPLASSIRQRYPVAMIDEFQDTDPQQYRIFSTIYSTRDDADTGLFLIGDPKQAIYGFRGADIFTYMQARAQVQAHYTLPTNYRSSRAMVAAVNAVFSFHDNPFIYREAIEFTPVQSRSQLPTQGVICEGAPQAALLFRVADQGSATLNKQEYQQLQARDCASQIARWLQAGQLDLGDESSRPIVAGDIAVLVRTNREGQLMAQALDQLAIPYVLRASRDSVFESEEGYQLYLQMAAALNPNDERMLRAALAMPLLGLNLTELEALNDDEQRWQQQVDTYFQYQRIWLRRGILPMLYRWLEQSDMAGRILQQRSGERQLTNLLHLGELLQLQSQQLDSPSALLRWFAQQLLDGASDSDDTQIRLESDARRVQIVTIHKSKGLEYPLVALPFMLNYRSASEAIYHRDGQLTLALQADPQASEQADEERLAEDLRLLYVALTRAKYHCLVGVGALAARANKNGTTAVEKSALGFLLQHGEKGTKATLLEALSQLAVHPDIDFSPVIDHWPEPLAADIQSEVALACRPLQRTLARDWWITSYSALSSHQGRQKDASMELAWLDRTVIDEEASESEQLDIFHFAKGPQAGTFLHSVFELIDFQASATEVETQLQVLMTQSGYDLQWLPVIAQLRQEVLGVAMDDGGRGSPFSLGELTPSQRLAEMEFVMPLSTLDASVLNRLLREHDPLSARAERLTFERVQGMLKGFIDLVFCVEGRYYVLDYKSNYLGDSADDYQRPAMEQAMIEHRYDFQYQIYALALHRMLTTRLPDYDYQQHFGGVYYLFLRGVSSEGTQPTGIYFSRPDAAFLMQLDRLLAGDAND
ncbi:exodeoxyribonuclease V subunit beta [Celerinatantimonas sp. YJH-8]|uniref:exodeoxyribonuclease V subunit beta n=1 Tax=Celerinatantimonas sp. YJH-8 TaxID=3228714 RepID=UPI0038C6C304